MITSFTGWTSVAERESFFFFREHLGAFPLRGSTNLCIHSSLSRLQRQYVSQFFIYFPQLLDLQLACQARPCNLGKVIPPIPSTCLWSFPFSFVSVQTACEHFSAFLLISSLSTPLFEHTFRLRWPFCWNDMLTSLHFSDTKNMADSKGSYNVYGL